MNKTPTYNLTKVEILSTFYPSFFATSEVRWQDFLLKYDTQDEKTKYTIVHIPHNQTLVDLPDPFPNDNLEKSVDRVDTREPD